MKQGGDPKQAVEDAINRMNLQAPSAMPPASDFPASMRQNGNMPLTLLVDHADHDARGQPRRRCRDGRAGGSQVVMFGLNTQGKGLEGCERVGVLLNAACATLRYQCRMRDQCRKRNQRL